MSTTVGDLLRIKGAAVETTAASATILEAIRRMGERHIGCLAVVTKTGKLTGILSERDCLLDFMVLGYQSIGHEIDIGAQFGLEEIEPHLKPVQLVFPADQRGGVQIPVYFFAPDGQTPIQTSAAVYCNSPTILLSHSMEKGCSGGPIFTADHRLIGIVQGSIDSGGHLSHEGHAIRIDKASAGWLCDELGGFEPFILAPYIQRPLNQNNREPQS